LQSHIQKVREDAERTLRDWQASIKEQELAEKRRLAPGWLDREEKILEPERSGHLGTGPPAPGKAPTELVNIMDQQDDRADEASEGQITATTAGDELDRAFGGMALGRDY
jgi:hypothetical protein